MTSRSAMIRIPVVAVLLLALVPWTAMSHGLCMCGVLNLNCMPARQSAPSSCHGCAHHDAEEAPKPADPVSCACFEDAAQPFAAPDAAPRTAPSPTVQLLFPPAILADAIFAAPGQPAACVAAVARGTPCPLRANCILRI